MATLCGGDPLVCIELVAWGIGEFLKDWTTMAMLAILLGLLLKVKADRQKAREDEYARKLEAYEEQRNKQPQARTWAIENDKFVER